MGTKPPTKRKIAFIITSFIHYSRSFLLLAELQRRPDVDLHVILGGTVLLARHSSRHARVKDLLQADQIKNIHEIHFALEGDTLPIKAKTAGLAMVEFVTAFHDLKPDLVVVRGDRFEVLSAAMAASYMNIPIAHIEGGDVSGTIDESIRHAITKLAHIHLVTNDDARKRVERLGERPDYIFNFGSCEAEIVKKFATGRNISKGDFKKNGSGADIDIAKDYLLVMFHPVWQDAARSETTIRNTQAILNAVNSFNMPAIWFWPNYDVGAEDVLFVLRKFNNDVSNHQIRFTHYYPPKDFIRMLSKAQVLIGNSSSGIKESSVLGVPVVNIGSRQASRLRGKNVTDVSYESTEIIEAIQKQLAVKRYSPDQIYAKDKTSKKISDVLAKVPLYVQKEFHQ